MKKWNVSNKSRAVKVTLNKIDCHKVENRNWSYISEDTDHVIRKRDIKGHKKTASSFSTSKVKGFNPILVSS